MIANFSSELLYATVDSEDLNAALDRIEAQIDDTGLRAFQETRVWPWLRERTQERFANEGLGWAPLAKSTQSFRRKQGFPAEHPINVRTGALKAYALTHQVETRKGEAVLIQPMVGGSRLTQTKFRNAQLGGISDRGLAAGGGGRYPARPVVDLTFFDANEIMARLDSWVTS